MDALIAHDTRGLMTTYADDCVVESPIKVARAAFSLAGKTVRGGLVPIYELSRQGDYCDGVRNFGDSAESTLSFGALT